MAIQQRDRVGRGQVDVPRARLVSQRGVGCGLYGILRMRPDHLQKGAANAGVLFPFGCASAKAMALGASHGKGLGAIGSASESIPVFQ